MAKKKKNRKTRKQKIAQAQTQKPQAVLANTSHEPSDKNISPKVSKKTDSKNIASVVSEEQARQNSYVQKDIRRSLVLTGIILVVFVVLYIVLDKTSVGTEVYKIIKI